MFIVITTAATLHAHGVIQVQTSAQAAEALRAVAGPLTFVVFAVGIIGTGMPALPDRRCVGRDALLACRSRNLPPRAKALYATIAVGMAPGVALNFSAIDPIRRSSGARC